MIPKVRTWNVRIPARGNEPEERLTIDAPNKALARIIVRMDYPRFWGRGIKISLAKIQA